MTYHSKAFGQIDLSYMDKMAAEEAARRAAAPKCATQEQKDKAVAACKARTTVKGVGQIRMFAFTLDPFANIDPCYVASLPLCAPPPPAYAPPPASTTTYTPPPSDYTPPAETPEEEEEPNYMLWGGLALLLVAAGGYVAYKATRK